MATLLECLLRDYPDAPKRRAKEWILSGRVSVRGQVVRKPHQSIDPASFDSIELSGRHAAALDCGPGWEIHPRVILLHLDSALAIVNKGPGLVSVPAPNCILSALSILADFLAGRLRARKPPAAGGRLPSAYRRLIPLPVHRLDQYTSGAFCMAMNPEARLILIEQLKTHAMIREYVAFVDGRPSTRSGTWRHWLRLSNDQMRQQIVGNEPKAGEQDASLAITHYEVIAEYPPVGSRGFTCKLRLRLETGRKHQIRIQAASAGLPLIGDRVYNPAYRAAFRSGVAVDFPRQALHAEKLTLEHPERPGTRMSWTAELPKDLRQLEASLKRKHDGMG